jgi:HAD superfamily hydrolase (TIGR01509 family)
MFELPDRDYSAFIFDCDGTLADTMPLHQKAWILALRAHGATFDFGWELFMRRAGMALERTVEELNLEFSLNMDPLRVAADQRRHYHELMHELQPIPEVVDFARSKAGKYPLSVASGGERWIVLETLQMIGAWSLFPVVVVAADVPRGKPAPDLFLLAAQKMGVHPHDCLVFEDGLLGIEAARSAGMGAVLVGQSPRRGAASNTSDAQRGAAASARPPSRGSA